MSTVRSLAVFLAMLITALLVTPSAAAQPPFRLGTYITDDAGALNGSGRAAIQSATGKLYSDRRIQLWVVFVDNFSGQSAVSWAQSTPPPATWATSMRCSPSPPSTVPTRSWCPIGCRPLAQVRSMICGATRSNPRYAAATGAVLRSRRPTDSTAGRSRRTRTPLLIALGVIVIVVIVLFVAMRYRRRRRRAAELAAARRVDATDPDALAALSLGALDDLSRWKVVDVDNAVRTSANELALTIEEFGEQRTEPFSRAVNSAKAALAQAFTVRQQLDDAIPETRAQRRELLTQVIVSAARADRELESQREAFEQMRDLVVNAPSRLDGLTQQMVELTARIAPAEQRMTELHNEFDPAALTSVATNVTTAKDRLAFADQNLSRARDLAAKPVSGEQSGLVDAVQAGESALGQARALLDAVDSAANDIRHAVATLPSLIADIQAGIEHADTELQSAQQTKAAHIRELASVRDAAKKALDAARASGSADPLGAFTQLTKADADLNRLLATVAEEQATAERLNRTFEQTLFTAQSRIHAVSDYIDTRRGSIGPEARTRLAEASRQLQAAQDKRETDISEAITRANTAATLAAQAQSLANDDVQSAQLAYTGRYGGGNHMGAMMGGIIIGDMLGGTMSGGFGGGWGGGWGPTSFGGSSGSSDGGFMGGGGRF